jgi:hypothetical protein
MLKLWHGFMLWLLLVCRHCRTILEIEQRLKENDRVLLPLATGAA